ncbi:hypothetical protein ACSTS3_14430 [Aquimarina muelleri]|uniref:hypothetical protein n=1 Tax=Aquimarina muelleri TaxID=279356 RepID=UPI003F684E51
MVLNFSGFSLKSSSVISSFNLAIHVLYLVVTFLKLLFPVSCINPLPLYFHPSASSLLQLLVIAVFPKSEALGALPYAQLAMLRLSVSVTSALVLVL